VDVLAKLSSPVTLVTLGPLTNLAHALTIHPGLVRERVVRHIGMFGNLHEQGNTNRWADFNAWCDPEAVNVVFDAALPTDMVGLDVTRRMTFSAAEVERIRHGEGSLSRWLGNALSFYVEFHRAQERLDGCVVNDVLTIAELLDPGLLRFAGHRLTVGLDDGGHRGHTQVSNTGAAVRVALEVDVHRVRRLLGRVFGAGFWEDASRKGASS
jgi:inosine-uridine nucleoside N-ribohydrolase